MASATMTPGRRLRLDRRKAGLDQKGLAELLGSTVEEVSEMENNRVALTSKAQAFISQPPTPVPTPARPGKGRSKGPEEQPEPEHEPEPAEGREGPGPRVEQPTDRPPTPGPSKGRELAPARGEIAELEDALLKMFAGEAFLVPRIQPDGTTTQIEAVIPGIAQMVGMYDEFDGQIIRTYAPGMAKAWAELARQNPTVRKILVGLTYGGAYRGVIAATAPALLAIVMHHGALGLGGPRGSVVEHRGNGAADYSEEALAQQAALDEEIARLEQIKRGIDPETGQYDPNSLFPENAPRV